jgi:hypothetical protein
LSYHDTRAQAERFPSAGIVSWALLKLMDPSSPSMNHLLQSVSHRFSVPTQRPEWLLAGLVAFGVGFGFVEAAVVADLRAILRPISRESGRTSADGVFPMLTIDQLGRDAPVAARLMRVETLREAATLLMLAGVGLAAGRTALQRFSAFLVAFGIWDLTYYLFLKALLGWPASVWTWDILFLIPVPWAAPVFAPVAVAAPMVIAGSAVLLLESTGRPFRVTRWQWAAVCGGGAILVLAFCWDWRNVAAGGLPNPFPWPIFLVGETIALGGFVHASWETRRVLAARHGTRHAPEQLVALIQKDTDASGLLLGSAHDRAGAG